MLLGGGKDYQTRIAYAISDVFFGTFSGLMNASEDTKHDEERVTPSGPFALLGVFCFVWASAYTANLAATLTQEIQNKHRESDYLAKNGDSVCAKLGAAYTADLIETYPNLDVKTYPR